MAGRGCLFHTGLVPVLLVLVTTMLCAAGASAQSSSTCTSALVSLSPCLNYITGNDTNPSSSCCSQLASVVQSEPQCLCMVLDGGTSSLGISVNETQAMALPTACKVQTPPVSKCNSTGSPTTPSSSTPAAPGSPAGGDESKTLDASGGSDTRVAAASTIIYSLLFAVASLCMTSVTF